MNSKGFLGDAFSAMKFEVESRSRSEGSCSARLCYVFFMSVYNFEFENPATTISERDF